VKIIFDFEIVFLILGAEFFSAVEFSNLPSLNYFYLIFAMSERMVVTEGQSTVLAVEFIEACRVQKCIFKMTLVKFLVT